MSDISRVLLFIVSCVFTQNVVFTRLLIGRGLAENRRVGVAAGLGLAVTLVMTLASLCGWVVYNCLLVPMHAEYLKIIALVAVVLLAAWVVELLLAKVCPALAGALGEGFTAAAVSCAVLGIAIINIDQGYGLGYAVLGGLFGGLGYLLALVLMAGVQDRLETSRIPRCLKGLPISLISASLIALAFMGFAGLA